MRCFVFSRLYTPKIGLSACHNSALGHLNPLTFDLYLSPLFIP